VPKSCHSDMNAAHHHAHAWCYHAATPQAPEFALCSKKLQIVEG
jgi:hypothetical protein